MASFCYCRATRSGKVTGLMPDGNPKVFNSVNDYEDAYFDMWFEMNNCFEVELPEDYAA